MKPPTKDPPIKPTPSPRTLELVERAVTSAHKHHIKLKHGTPNLADGNCAIESCILNINDRDCFPEKMKFSAEYYRKIWFTDMKNRTIHDETWNIYSEKEWNDGWDQMLESGVYERGIFGDLMLPAISCGTRKFILVFNTSLDTPHDPVYVIDPNKFGVQPDSKIPIVLAYDLSHFESMHTTGEEDTANTVKLVEEYLGGKYRFGRKDMKMLIEIETEKQENQNSGVMETNKEERHTGSLKFEMNLPIHLRGKRPRDMTKEEKREYNNFRRKLNRMNETQEQADIRRLKDREAKKETKAKETQIHADIRKEKTRECVKKSRSKETQIQADIRKDKDKEFKKKTRSNESEIEKNARKEKDRVSKAIKKAKKIPKSNYDARNAQQIFTNEIIVPELKDTSDKIGFMSDVCKYCSAMKWKAETPSLCCNNNKVNLDPFPLPPRELQKLLLSDTVEARLFRENIRSFNNALALSSIKVNERKFKNGYSPSVIFEGKVCQIFGPLQPEEGQEPKFAQLYVVDPSQEHTIRVKRMCIPSHLNKKQINLMTQTLKNLQELLKQINPYVKDLLHVCEIPDSDLKDGKLIISCQARPKGTHERTYNIQQSLSEVSVLTNSVPSDLVLRKRGGGLEFIYDLHPAAQPLHFVLLFPFGTKGYSEFMKHTDQKKRVSPREYYAFHLNMRNKQGDFLFRCGRLFQEFICLGYATVENQKLKFDKTNQGALRADTYKNIKDVLTDRVPIGDKISKDDHNLKIGKRIVLPKSFVGSPRWYNCQFQDGMAICRKYHKPDFFITMTCNTNWEEIQRELRKGESAKDRPDIVARVFKQKKDQLMRDIRVGQVLGKVPAMLWVIEFQKRGLPHAHLLVILSQDDRITSSTDIDNVISAQLPPDPAAFPPGPQREQAERLEQIVLQNMVHGPCGKLNPLSPCMSDGKCTKGFPKRFIEKTVVSPDNMYPEYQRLCPEDGGRSILIKRNDKEFVIDNRWIVPYSPFFSLRYNCHINFELCMSALASKYLFKYATKGQDRAMLRTEVETGEETVDEIEQYIDMRSIGSSEACWHIFNFNIAKKFPAVIALRVHLKDEQHVVFDMGNEQSVLETHHQTELTGFFEANRKNKNINLTYVDFPEQFTWDGKNKEWKPRKQIPCDTIGRIHTVNPVAGDVYYLRMLLHHEHSKGKISFDDIMTVDGEKQESYQEICRLLGLLQDDREWDEALLEATVTKMPKALRELFVIIILFCMSSNPRQLFLKHYLAMAEDYEARELKNGVNLSEKQKMTLVLLDLKSRLQSWDKGLSLINMNEPSADDLDDIAFTSMADYPVLIQEELDFDLSDMKQLVDRRKTEFTDSQRNVFETVLAAVHGNFSQCVFIDARGGTGKTFVLNAVLAAVRIIEGGSVALAVAATGIAANLLMFGRTLHSRFKLPLNITCDSVCNIDAQSTLAKLIRMAKIIVWDEAPMSDRYQLEALDRSLRDITSQDIPFGGKVLVLSGDSRQCLPVIPGANRAEIVNASLNRSPLWPQFKIMKLSENMRVRLSNSPEADTFDKFTLSIGDGTAENIEDSDMIELPAEMCMQIRQNTPERPNSEMESMMTLAAHVYPDMNKNYKTKGWMEGRAILAPTNQQVNVLNNIIADRFPGKPFVLTSSDELINPDDFQRYNIEYLTTLSPSGLPSHRLFVKSGMPLMLMRNLNQKMGLCNGTKLIFIKLHKKHILECVIAGGEHNGRVVLIPRIFLRPKDREFPFEWSRKQFPVNVAFAMTINKSQGQTLRNVGIWLQDTCFAHGQLYVCVSRVSSPSSLRFAIRQVEGFPPNATSNVVYKEVLIKGKFPIIIPFIFMTLLCFSLMLQA